MGESVDWDKLDKIPLDNTDTKFSILFSLSKEFGHSVHNSRLHEMVTLAEVLLFYEVYTLLFIPWTTWALSIMNIA